ncbi:tn5468, transposase protein B [Brevibacillus laterosporus GI-9]|uniref:Mu transposase C-terminal domain-containing protein n=1 Tax=Brevibacillus laterosporus TaxID=1465 RepID=UPI00024054B9|nr:Mu transposase C-terminal domain-containing protein [Brevibacillus laterosporus]CCF16896.1 tn5468, transposase protein B [Brevibacillus laterosporus GI-9]
MLEWLVTNTVIEWKDGNADPLDQGHIERILWIDPQHEKVVTIALEDEKALPQVRTMEEYVKISHKKQHRVIEFFQFLNLIIDEASISEKHKEIRNTAWKIIAPMVEQEPDVFDSKLRGAMISEAVNKYQVHKSTIYRYLRRYWQAGKMINALLPYYNNSGGLGTERKSGDVKRGRPKKFSDEPTGVNITDEIKQSFRSGIRLFYNTKEKAPLRRAYQKTLEAFFNIGFQKNGDVRIPILPHKDQLPTFGQFRYWYQKEFNIEESIKKRLGKRNFELKHRPILGSSTKESFGPGSRFQIDATIADVYLVSQYNREWIIGRPIIYVVIDVFSRYITGLYVGLEGPSWLGAMMALANTASDKVSYCADYGIKIEPDDWICSHLPQKLTADRGELEGTMPNNLINTLGVDVETEPPYRADWKGIVEQQFRLLNHRSIKWIPGAVTARNRERGERDYRLDAKLTLQEFTHIIIRTILYHNNQHHMDWYDRNEFIVADDKPAIPRELWTWGIKNRTGRLKKQPEDIVKLNLMYKSNASVTKTGIIFKGMAYSSDIAIREQWFTTARAKGSWSIQVAYDPRTTNSIYIWLDNGQRYETCHLFERDERYFNKRFEEVEDLLEIEKNGKKEKSDDTMRAKIELDAHVNAVVQEATRKTNQALENSELSNRQRTKNIRSNRKIEKELNQLEEAIVLGDSTKEQPTHQPDKVIPINKNASKTESGYIPPAEKTSRLRSILESLDGENDE